METESFNVRPEIPGACGICKGTARLADDYCRACSGTGYRFHSSNQLEAELAMLAEALSEAVADLTDLRAACAKAAFALRGLLPYFSRLPPETEQQVRKAVRSIVEVARG